ncbi:MAG TPA: polysaccharide deacetylase [Baekduia sp.]|nr:polysaccharide deacetylase [Baekduia sp.]
MADTAPRLSVCLTFDFDAMCGWVQESDNPAEISRGEFGAVAVPRVLGLLERHGIDATFFIPGHTLLAYPHLAREVRDRGHEIGHHGWAHEDAPALGPDGEREIFQRGLDALDHVVGVRPRGYRSPSGNYSAATIDVLLENGIEYDSHFSGSDFYPYYVRKGDRWSKTEPYEFGVPSELVEMPFGWHLDDFPHFEFTAGFSPTLNHPSAVREIWQGEFDFAHANCPGGVFVLCMHPDVIGRGYRITMLDGLISYMKEQDGVVFSRMGDAAARFRETTPLEEVRRNGHPVHAPHLLAGAS